MKESEENIGGASSRMDHLGGLQDVNRWCKTMDRSAAYTGNAPKKYFYKYGQLKFYLYQCNFPYNFSL